MEYDFVLIKHNRHERKKIVVDTLNMMRTNPMVTVQYAVRPRKTAPLFNVQNLYIRSC